MSHVGRIRQLETGVEWKIPGFFALPEYGMCSRPFQFQGEQWMLSILPWCWIKASLLRKSVSSECRVTCEVHFRIADETLLSLGEKSHTFQTFEQGWCPAKFHLSISEEERLRRDFVSGDELTIVCHLKIQEPKHVSQASRATKLEARPKVVRVSPKSVEAFTQTESDRSEPKAVKVSPQSVEASTQTESECCKLSSNLTELLLSGQDADLTVEVKGVEFRLHRGIMGARTPVFSAMLRHDVVEKATGIVSIDDCEAEVFRTFVHHAYSGRVNQMSTDTVFGLFALAEKYQVDDLKSACLDFIRGSLSVDTFTDVVTLALTYDRRELLQQATDFFARNMVDILQTVKWMNFMTVHSIQANELILKAAQTIKAK